MKKAILPILASITLISCNDIASDERYLSQASVEAQRAVLVEDFTGQNCVNCPAAHKILEKLCEQYGDKLIPVSIHAGGFGISVESTRYTGLMTPEGNIYNDAWGINEWPKGVINRHGAPSNAYDWASAVRTELARPASLAIDLEAGLDDNETLVTASVTLRPTSDIKGNLQVWILEDNIVAFQKDDELGRIPDYVHNHVYRASVNGVGGEPIELQSMIHRKLNFTIPVRDNEHEHWEPHNLSVVAFVYDNSGVQQCARAYVWTEPDSEATD